MENFSGRNFSGRGFSHDSLLRYKSEMEDLTYFANTPIVLKCKLLITAVIFVELLTTVYRSAIYIVILISK